jgi:RNA polymerase sigma factor (sigma-70 family)
MATQTLAPVLRQLRHHLTAQGQVSDRELLRRFVDRREEAAFAALVERHGGMVGGVCWRVLGHAHDVEDAVQATFLVLARRARSLRDGQALACWLHEVAYHTALKAQATRARQRALPPRPHTTHPADPAEEVGRCELHFLVEQELQALPEKYRGPLVLCYLEGKTHEQAARELGCPPGSMSWRLTKARELLRARLSRRGISPSAGLAALALARRPTAKLPTGGTIPEGVRGLADGVLKEMTMRKCQLTLALILSGVLALGGLGLLSLPARTAPPAPTGDAPPKAREKGDPPTAGKARPAEPLPVGAWTRLGTLKLRHENPVLCVTFSPDGKVLASTAMNGKIRLWDVATGNLIRESHGHGGSRESLVYSADGKHLYVTGSNVPSQLEAASLHRARWYLGSKRGIPAIALSPDGKTLAGGNSSGTVFVWEVASRKTLRTLGAGGAGAVSSLAFSPDGKTLTMAMRDSPTLSRWEMPSGKPLEPLTAPAGVSVLAYAPDGETLACACQDGSVTLWNIRNKTSSRLAGGKKPMTSLAWSPDGKRLATADREGTVRLWDPVKRTVFHTARHTRPVEDVAFSPDGKLLAWTEENSIRLYDVAGWKRIAPRPGHTSRIQEIAFSPDGKTLATGAANDHALYLWDVATGKATHLLMDSSYGVYTFAFSPDGKTLAVSQFSGGFDPDLRLWDPSTGRLRGKLSGPGSMVTCLAFSPDGKTLASGESARVLRLWDVAGQRQIRTWPGPVPDQSWTGPSTLTFTPEGDRLISTGHGEPICVWDPQTGKLERTFAGGPARIRSVALTPSGRVLATAEHAREIRLWERATGKEITRIAGHETMIFDIALSPDGRTLASASGDQTVRLWDVASGKELRCFRAGAPVAALAYSPDGKTLASGGWDTTILLWDVPAREERGPARLSADRLRSLWADLLAKDPGKGYRAVWSLASAPREAVPFLRERLTAATATDDRGVARLIADLDADQFDVREKATRALKELGPLAEEALRKALRETKSAEVRLRVRRLLAGRQAAAGLPAERLRSLRALDVLEQAGSTEALAEVSKKGGTAWLRAEAGRSLKRVQARRGG